MKQKSLKEYLEKLVAYNRRNKEVSTVLINSHYFDRKSDMIKRVHIDLYSRYIKPHKLFNRYMNNSKWIW